MSRPFVTENTRPDAIARLRSETFDVIILGGGINGAGVARDLALRSKIANVPLRIALVEQKHFGSGTSGKNSHLIHGGLRYLKQLDFSLVREALHEREVLLRIAPHLVEPQPFLMPLTGFGRELLYSFGLTLYDWLSGQGTIPHHRRVPLDEVQRLEPGLAAPGMTGAAEFYDGQVRSARLVLENIFEAISNGAVCANYVRVETHHREADSVWRLRLVDIHSGESFEARARSIVDATGPWAHDPEPRLVRGSHIVFPRLNHSEHAIAYFEESGRIIFFIPWGERRDCTLVGTTDVDHAGSPDQVSISAEEMIYLRSIAARIFPESAAMEPRATFSSLRPLLTSGGSATSATRDHRIFHDGEGILRITGGKFTTYRAMSEEAVDLLTGQIAPELQEVHVSADHALNGNTQSAIDALLAEVPMLAERYSLEPDDVKLAIRNYGILAPAMLECVPSHWYGRLSQFDTGRLMYAIRHEMVLQEQDFFESSTTLAFEGRAPAPPGSGFP